MLPKTIFSKRETHGLRGWRGRVEQLFEQFRIGRIISAISRGKSRMKLISRRNFFSSSLCRRLITLEFVYENFNTIAAFLHAKLWKIIPLFARNICPPVDRIRFFPVFFFSNFVRSLFQKDYFRTSKMIFISFFFFFFKELSMKIRLYWFSFWPTILIFRSEKRGRAIFVVHEGTNYANCSCDAYHVDSRCLCIYEKFNCRYESPQDMCKHVYVKYLK